MEKSDFLLTGLASSMSQTQGVLEYLENVGNVSELQANIATLSIQDELFFLVGLEEIVSTQTTKLARILENLE